MEELNKDQVSDNKGRCERSKGEEKLGDKCFENEELKNGAKEEEEEMVLQFLDSLDSYVTLMESLSSTLRQGWFDLASARYSMGSSRVTSALFDLKLHSAATTLKVTQLDEELPVQDPVMKQPEFSLSRWSSTSEETESNEEDLHKEINTSILRNRNNTSPLSPRSPLTVDDQVQKERSKPLSVFGTLVSPKLRDSQVSFETALEMLVEMANMRSKLLSAHAQIQQSKDATISFE